MRVYNKLDENLDTVKTLLQAAFVYCTFTINEHRVKPRDNEEPVTGR